MSLRVRQISLDLVVDDMPKKDEERFLWCIRNHIQSLPSSPWVVGGPQFTDASWTKEEYGLKEYPGEDDNEG